MPNWLLETTMSESQMLPAHCQWCGECTETIGLSQIDISSGELRMEVTSTNFALFEAKISGHAQISSRNPRERTDQMSHLQPSKTGTDRKQLFCHSHEQEVV